MTEQYQKWVDWEKQNNTGEPLTRTQKEFAEYILQNEELSGNEEKKKTGMLQHPGNLLSIMQRIQKYLKR